MRSTFERFAEKVHLLPCGGCWEWRAKVNLNGYGYFWNGQAMQLAHRFSYEHWVGPIPTGLDLDHLCRNRDCVNPSHLEPVTRSENLRRGKPAGSHNRAKTHCPQGHPYDGANLYVAPSSGRRGCRTCRADANTRRR